MRKQRSHLGKPYHNEGQIGWFVAGSALNLIAGSLLYIKTLCETERFFVS
jgi:hypothetical protein